MRPSPFFKLAFSRNPYYKTRSFSLPYGIASFPSAIPQARLSHPRLLSPRNFPSAAQMKGCAGFPPRVREVTDSPIRHLASLIGPRLPIRGPIAAQGFPPVPQRLFGGRASHSRPSFAFLAPCAHANAQVPTRSRKQDVASEQARRHASARHPASTRRIPPPSNQQQPHAADPETPCSPSTARILRTLRAMRGLLALPWLRPTRKDESCSEKRPN